MFLSLATDPIYAIISRSSIRGPLIPIFTPKSKKFQVVHIKPCQMSQRVDKPKSEVMIQVWIKHNY